MSGKGEGKKRNRAAQSEQHGFQERPLEQASRPAAGEPGGAEIEKSEKQRVLEKMRDLEERRRQKEEQPE